MRSYQDILMTERNSGREKNERKTETQFGEIHHGYLNIIQLTNDVCRRVFDWQLLNGRCHKIAGYVRVRILMNR